jgi:hypothetical protein
MSLGLQSSHPKKLAAKSYHEFPSGRTRVAIGTQVSHAALGKVGENTVDMPMDDFVQLVLYVLTNSDLSDNDPRLELVRLVKLMDVEEGFGAAFPPRLCVCHEGSVCGKACQNRHHAGCSNAGARRLGVQPFDIGRTAG